MSEKQFYLAQLNLGRIRLPFEDSSMLPSMEEAIEQLDRFWREGRSSRALTLGDRCDPPSNNG